MKDKALARQYGTSGKCIKRAFEEMKNKQYSLKWNIEMSQEYKEYLLNLFAQGFFSELWEQIIIHNHEALKVFAKEVNDIQYKFLADHLGEFHI